MLSSIKKAFCLMLAVISVIPTICAAAQEDRVTVTPKCESEKIEVGDQFLVSFTLENPTDYMGFQVEGNFDKSLAEIIAPVYSQPNFSIIENTFYNYDGYFCLSEADLTLTGSRDSVLCSVLFQATAAGRFKLEFPDHENGVQIIRYRKGDNGELYYTSYANDFYVDIIEDTDGENVWIIKDPDPITPYNDMDGFSWAEKSVAVLNKLGALNFVEGDSFCPAQNVTRGEFIDMLMNVCKIEKYGDPEEFKDVSEKDYYYDSIMTAKSVNIIKGDGSGNFSPKEYISREDVCTLLFRTMSYMRKVRTDVEAEKYLSEFPDGDSVSEYARDSVAAMIRARIIRGDDLGNIRPSDNMTRAEAAVALNRVAEFNKLISL